MLRDRRVSRVGAGRMVWGPLLAMVLSACGSDGSEPAQRAPNDLALAQCELIDGTVLGEPMDPIVLDGVPTQACRITAGHVPGGSRTNLKWSHRYEPLVWILDGTLEIGDNRTYASVEEFVNDEFASLDTTSVSGGSGVLRATAGSVIVVHRNGYFNGDVMPLDETLGGSGEWGGVVVNSIGPHPDCPADTGANRFCNVEGTYGYYAGLSALDAETAVIGEAITGGRRGPPRLGFNGSVSGGGGVVEGAQARAAVVLNAPQSQRSRTTITVFDSGATGVDINGGHTGTALRLVTRNTRGAAVHWHGDFSGGVSGIFYHDQAEAPALHGIGGKVELNGVTLIDRDFKAGTAISVQGGRIDLTNVVVQNFRHCLQLDAGAGAGFAGVAFGCLEPTLAAADGIDHAAGATGAAREDPERAYYEADPGLTADLRVGNPQLVYEDWPFASGGLAVISSVQNHAGRDLRLIYPDCMGVGTLLPEDQVLVVRRETYRICELSGTVDANVRLYSHFNGGRFAWVLNGEVSLGADFAALEEAERLAALESPHYVFMPQGTVVYARANAGLTVQPGMQWYVDGTADHPVEIAALPGDEPANWGGVRIHGVDRAGCQTGERDALCVHAAQPRVRIEYLRLLQAGNGRAALQLYQVGPGARIDHLEIAASASNGLEVHGGRANLKHLLLTHNVGDQLVWQDGWRGTIQHGLFTSGAASTGQVLRGRNHSVDHDATPRSRPTLANLTMVGQGTGSAILLEQGSGLLLYNSIVSAFGTCFDIDDAATAALQSGTPQDIAMFDVVLNCTEALADDDEAGGFDYGYATTHSSGVHELDPQLDQNFVATSAALPAPAGRLNLNPVGDAARYLDDRAGHWGAVSGAEHGWYLGWSGVGVLLSPECDGKGTLVDDYRYPFWVSVTQPAGWATRIELDYKVCRLPASISEDLELTRYTGADKQVNADGYVVVTESGAPYGVPGEVTWMHLPVPTIWLLDGVVTVGDGAAELVGTEEVSTLKADPVELTLQPGTLVMAAERGGLHITRGGRLRIRGEPMLEQEHCSAADAFSRRCRAATTGPVSIFGVPDEGLPMLSPAYLQADRIIRITGTYAAYAPLGGLGSAPWQGITVDGFARNNQCEEAATAAAGSRVCNIAGELGQHGGYDDDHANLEVRNLYMTGGLLRFNSVAGTVEGLSYHAGRYADEQVGEVAVLALDGGTTNLREVLIDLSGVGDSRKPGTLIAWNHGYRGNLQYIYGASMQVADGGESLVQAHGRNYFVPLVRGANGDPGHEDDLPRSLPTIVNLSLRTHETEQASGQMTAAVDSSLIELARGSGLHLYHSVMGATDGDGRISDYCFKLDDGAAARLSAGELLVSQLAATCQALSDDAALSASLGAGSGVDNTYAGSAGAVFAEDSEQDYLGQMQVNRLYDRPYPRQQVVDDYGVVMLEVSASPTADMAFLQLTDYLGTLDYWNKP